MPRSRRPGLQGFNPPEVSTRTPGLQGLNDRADPSWRERGSLLGDTPGLLGLNDWADPKLNLMLAANSSTAASQERALTFSEYAEKRMWDLLKDYSTQVGSHRGEYLRRNSLPDDMAGKTRTDCITYVINVLKYAFEQIGNREAARKVGGLGEHGTELAAYLTGIGWKAHYWNPDVNNPPDGLQEHPYSYRLAVKTGKYYTVPVSGYMINYRPTSVNPPKKQTPKDQTTFDEFSKVRFAYGTAKGGVHTFLCSYGMVYEVHWEGIGEGLYERSSLYTFEWNSGIVVTPPDATFTSAQR
ncbi:MAG TPA: hypothetical protein VGO91_13625 [Pyrinomonadaceae bacterium]|jgi:hypothetical protein|nr:hypothetical protein [Pyrinomonadaceae bacterium]